jgi:hypothetical protein
VFGNDRITSIVRDDSEMARNEEIRTPDATDIAANGIADPLKF